MTQMSHRILSLISHSVGVARLDHFHDEVGSGAVRAGFANEGRGECQKWRSCLHKCKERREGDRKERQCILCAPWRGLTPNGSVDGKHFHSFLLCNTFFYFCPARKLHSREHLGRSYVFRSSAHWETKIGGSKQEKHFFFFFTIASLRMRFTYAPVKTVIHSHKEWTLLKVVPHIMQRLDTGQLCDRPQWLD